MIFRITGGKRKCCRVHGLCKSCEHKPVILFCNYYFSKGKNVEKHIIDWVSQKEKDKDYKIHDIVVTRVFADRYRVDAYRKKTFPDKFVPKYNIQNSWFLRVKEDDNKIVIQDCTVPQDNPLYREMFEEMKK